MHLLLRNSVQGRILLPFEIQISILPAFLGILYLVHNIKPPIYFHQSTNSFSDFIFLFCLLLDWEEDRIKMQVNCYLLHVPRLPSQPASSRRGWVIDFILLELPWQYIAMTRNNLSIILISLHESLSPRTKKNWTLVNSTSPTIEKLVSSEIGTFELVKLTSI